MPYFIQYRKSNSKYKINSKPNPNRKTSSSRSTKNLLLGLLLGSLIGYLINNNPELKKLKIKPIQDYVTQLVNESSISNKKNEPFFPSTAIQSKPKKVNEPRFDFYNILPKTEIKPIYPQALNSSLPDSRPSSATQFYLQAGSFNSIADAQVLKARLVLLGFNPHLQYFKASNGSEWHRVILGPFHNETALNKQKEHLEALKIFGSLTIKN
ncbi:MAG: hypothetical protein JWM09_1156 [Francisellaceae bacterium]|nr:hypothetical protein [Francisellaceae bacterium]